MYVYVFFMCVCVLWYMLQRRLAGGSENDCCVFRPSSLLTRTPRMHTNTLTNIRRHTHSQEYVHVQFVCGFELFLHFSNSVNLSCGGLVLKKSINVFCFSIFVELSSFGRCVFYILFK